jgi:hypothetical protein
MTDNNKGQPCRVIPFIRPKTSEESLITSNIAAVIAVTVLHDGGESPETRLLDIIESSGEAEVFELIDAIDHFDDALTEAQLLVNAANDNAKMKPI